MTASIHQIIKVEIVKYLYKEVFAQPGTISTVLGRPLGDIVAILRSNDFYCDDKGFYALQGQARQAVNAENTEG